MKRTLSLFLILALCLTFVPLRAARAKAGGNTLAITVEPPQAGAHPSFSFSCTPSDAIDMDSSEIFWSQMQPTKIGEMIESDTFVAGGVYRIYIWLSALGENGFGTDVNVTVNGQSAAGETASDYSSWSGTYTFPAIPISIPTAAVTISAPTAGAAPDYSPVVPSGAHYDVDSVDWFDVTENHYLNYDPSVVFEVGHQYRVYVYFYAEDGYQFNSSSSGTINGKAATCEIMNQELLMKYAFPVLSASKPAITTQPKAVTVVAGKKATFTVVAEGADSYKWQYQKPGTSTWTNVSKNGTLASYSLTTAAKHNGCKYRCKMTNAAGSVYTKAVTLTVK